MENLSKENAALNKRVVSLEEQAEDLSVSSRSNDIIVSGGRLPASTIGENCPAVVPDTSKREVNYEIDASIIVSAYRLVKNSPFQGLDKRKIVVKLSNVVNRTDLIQACKRVKPSGLFVNESITSLKSRILFAVRQAKRRYPARVSVCGSHDGRVFVWLKPECGDGRNIKTYLDSMVKLSEWSQAQLGITLSELCDFGEEQ